MPLPYALLWSIAYALCLNGRSLTLCILKVYGLPYAFMVYGLCLLRMPRWSIRPMPRALVVYALS